MSYRTQQAKKWQALCSVYNSLHRSPLIRDGVWKEYLRLCAARGCINAMEEALIKYDCCYKIDERPMDGGALDYEDIMEGAKIWDDIRKTSAT